MDAALAAIVGAVIGAIAGVGGAWVQARSARALEGDRQAREDRFRWAVERRGLYARFMLVATPITDELTDRLAAIDEEHEPIDLAPLHLAYQELRLMAPPAAIDPLAAVYTKLLVGNTLLSGDPSDPATAAAPEILEDIGDLWGRLLDAFREDLGVGAVPAVVEAGDTAG